MGGLRLSRDYPHQMKSHPTRNTWWTVKALSKRNSMRNSFIYLYMIGALLIACSTEQAKDEHSEHNQHEAEATQYTCSMHPQVLQDKPGSCPICGMDLVKVTK